MNQKLNYVPRAKCGAMEDDVALYKLKYRWIYIFNDYTPFKKII